MPEVRVLEAIVGLLIANISARFLVVKIVKKKTSMLAAVINMEVIKTIACFLTTLNKSLNSDFFCYNCNT